MDYQMKRSWLPLRSKFTAADTLLAAATKDVGSRPANAIDIKSEDKKLITIGAVGKGAAGTSFAVNYWGGMETGPAILIATAVHTLGAMILVQDPCASPASLGLDAITGQYLYGDTTSLTEKWHQSIYPGQDEGGSNLSLIAIPTVNLTWILGEISGLTTLTQGALFYNTTN